jgi:transposase-like protein
MNRTERDEPHETPTICPFCRSTKLVATGKSVSDSTYWRCETCGELWNPSRSQVAPRRRSW